MPDLRIPARPGGTDDGAAETSIPPTLKRQLAERTLDRREFLRTATLLGMSAGAAYAFAGKVTGERFVPVAEAQTPPKGGTLRLGMRCQDLKSPHTYSWIESANAARQVCDYLAVTGVDNITRPGLVEKWEASPDLKTWTLRIRRNVSGTAAGRSRPMTPSGTSSASSTPRRDRPRSAS